MKPEPDFNFIPSPYFQTDAFKRDTHHRMMRDLAKSTVGIFDKPPKVEIKIIRRKLKWYDCRAGFRYALWTAIGFQWGSVITRLIISIWSK